MLFLWLPKNVLASYCNIFLLPNDLNFSIFFFFFFPTIFFYFDGKCFTHYVAFCSPFLVFRCL